MHTTHRIDEYGTKDIPTILIRYLTRLTGHAESLHLRNPGKQIYFGPAIRCPPLHALHVALWLVSKGGEAQSSVTPHGPNMMVHQQINKYTCWESGGWTLRDGLHRCQHMYQQLACDNPIISTVYSDSIKRRSSPQTHRTAPAQHRHRASAASIGFTSIHPS